MVQTPDHVFRSLLDQVKAETATANPSKTGKVERLANNTENLYNFISGKTQPVANPHIARWSDNIRNWLVASRLGSALLSSFSDLGTMYLSAKVTNLPMNQLFRNQLEAMDPTNRTELARARRAGLAMESLLGSVNRWAMDNMGAVSVSLGGNGGNACQWAYSMVRCAQARLWRNHDGKPGRSSVTDTRPS